MQINLGYYDMDFDCLNSATKYPSIETYHKINGYILTDDLTDGKSFAGQNVYITEKIDGSNGRIIITTDDDGLISDFLIGTRNDIIYARGDRVLNHTERMVDSLIPESEIIIRNAQSNTSLLPNSIYVLYGENYGGRICGWKQYTTTGECSIRYFDMWHMPVSEFIELLNNPIDSISSWRDHGGQPYVSVTELKDFVKTFLGDDRTVPYIKESSGDEIPTEFFETSDWMKQFATSVACISPTGLGSSEGVVVRTEDRKLIRKLRFEDYRKSISKRNNEKK